GQPDTLRWQRIRDDLAGAPSHRPVAYPGKEPFRPVPSGLKQLRQSLEIIGESRVHPGNPSPPSTPVSRANPHQLDRSAERDQGLDREVVGWELAVAGEGVDGGGRH